MFSLDSLSEEDLSYILDSELTELKRLMSLTSDNQISLSEIWFLMDVVWDEMECDNKKLDPNKISQYYSHSVWLLNGLFIENHDISLQHRRAIVSWISNHSVSRVLDFGGGVGTLARMLSEDQPSLDIEVYEPFPSQYALKKSSGFKNIKFINEPSSQYDCIICTDVLEHVPDPLQLLADMVKFTKVNGYLLIANHFFPCIKCHLPCTFHFRYTFDQFTDIMGLEKIGQIQKNYISIYQKIPAKSDFDWPKIRRNELKSKALFGFYEIRYVVYPLWKVRIIRFLKNPIYECSRIRDKVLALFYRN